jgi:serine/threonine protein kinase
MTPQRHARIQEIFEAALDFSPDAREIFVADACGSDSELRAAVTRLLSVATDDATVISSRVMECPQCGRCFDGPIGCCPADSEPLEPALPGSRQIDGKYQIERTLGRGGMGAVFLTTHTSLDKRFALKVILSHGAIPAAYTRRFETEARILGRLRHTNIVSVTDYGVDPREGGTPYLVMEYLEGETLRDHLEERNALSAREALPLLYALAAAIDHAHGLNIVHGDLKPPNVILSHADGRVTAKVLDFGLAQLSPDEPSLMSAGSPTAHTNAGTIRGTPGYMAPELLRAEPLSNASDLFAFGVMIYEMLTGSLPFGRRFEELSERMLTPPKPPSQFDSGLPPQVDAPILQLLDPDPKRRPALATTAVREVESALLTARQQEWRSRETPRRALIASVAAALILTLVVTVSRSDFLVSLEEGTADLRIACISPKPPDPRLLVVSVDQPALDEDRRPLAAWGPEFAGQVERMFTNGARAVAIDLLLPPSWGEIAGFRQLLQRYSGRLVLGIYSAPSGELVGAESVGRLSAMLLGPDRYAKLFGFVNLEERPDGVIRRASYSYLDREQKWRPSLAWAAVQSASLAPSPSPPGPVWIDFSARAKEVSSMSWKDVDRAVADHSFRGRLVLIGASFPGSGDDLRVPAFYSEGLISGVKLHALIANTFLSPEPIRDAPHWTWLAPVYAAAAAILFVGLRLHRPVWLTIAGAAVFTAYAAVAFVAVVSIHVMVPLAAPEITIILAVLSSLLLKSRLSPYPVSFGQGEQS